MVSRRAVLGAIPAALVLPLMSCRREPEGGNKGRGAGGAGGEGGRVVVYCSADAVYARPILEAFAREQGVTVEPLFDTEATKTTGLVQRLIDEKGSPRCDVWWSSEPFGTIRLIDEGVLEDYKSSAALKQAGSKDWPLTVNGGGGETFVSSYGFATRARVFVVNTKFVEASERPGCLADLCRGAFKGRVGIAKPAFGTTRGHVAAIAAHYGDEGLREWLVALKGNDVRLLDGNGAVVRAVANGEVHVGLTDTDDVFAGQREGWPVEMAYESKAASVFADSPKIAVATGMGVMEIPNTVAMVKRSGRSGADQSAAERMVDYLLSAKAQLALAASESKNRPVAVREEEIRAAGLEPSMFAWGDAASIDMNAVAGKVAAAMKIVEEVFGT